ncbi:MAG: hypothetical protein ACLUGF_01880 [Clostridium sp.]
MFLSGDWRVIGRNKKVFSKTYGDKLDYAQFREETHRMFDEK